MGILTNQNACRRKLTLFLVALVILWGHQPGFAETQDIEELRRTAEQGDAETQFRLGQAYSFGRGVPQDSEEAAKWYRRAAEQGHSRAQFMLGDRYAHGAGVAFDYQEAVKWFRRAAEAGDVGAFHKLGLMYESGQGVSKNEREAAKWYRKAATRHRKAAEQGNVEAQTMLGSMYKTGRGVPQSHDQAVKWFRVAAEQGSAIAQLNLSLMVCRRSGRTPGPHPGGEVVGTWRPSRVWLQPRSASPSSTPKAKARRRIR